MLCYLFSFYLHASSSPTQRNASQHLLYCMFENLPWLFAAGICRGYLPWVFCIRKRILFCICEQILFIWKQTFFICDQNFLICKIFFINSTSFCYCRGSYGPPYNWAFHWEINLDSNPTKQSLEVIFSRKTKEVHHFSLTSNRNTASLTKSQNYLGVILGSWLTSDYLNSTLSVSKKQYDSYVSCNAIHRDQY